MAARKLAVAKDQHEKDEEAEKLKRKMEAIKHREDLNMAAAHFATAIASGEGPFEISVRIKDKASKKSVDIKATVDIGGLVHYRTDHDRLQILIPTPEFQKVVFNIPERARVEGDDD